MKTLISFICFVVLLTSCGQKDSVDDCIGIIDFIGPPSFQLQFVDSGGNNLIESGYYDTSDISASLNGQSYDAQIINFEVERLQNMVLLPSGIGNAGENTWVLRLSESETDTLDFSLVFNEVRDGGFCGTSSEVGTIVYNGNNIDLEVSLDTEFRAYLITINKTIE